MNGSPIPDRTAQTLLRSHSRQAISDTALRIRGRTRMNSSDIANDQPRPDCTLGNEIDSTFQRRCRT